MCLQRKWVVLPPPPPYGSQKTMRMVNCHLTDECTPPPPPETPKDHTQGSQLGARLRARNGKCRDPCKH